MHLRRVQWGGCARKSMQCKGFGFRKGFAVLFRQTASVYAP